MKVRRSRKPRLVVEELEARLVLSTTAISTVSSNWSGYAVVTGNGGVSKVSGSWTVPSVTGSGNAWSAVWVGIDGFSSNTVEQLGTEQDLVNGTPVYSAWYEMYPFYPVTISRWNVQAGDAISASVTALGSGSFLLAMTDTTVDGTVQSFSTTQTLHSAAQSSAEWVVEAPSSNSGVLPLANFGTVSITNASATLGNTAGPIDSASGQSYSVNMANRSGTEDTTSGLTDSTTKGVTTSGFSVTFTATTQTPPPLHHRHGRFQNNNVGTGQTGTTTSSGSTGTTAAAALAGALLNTSSPLGNPGTLATSTQPTSLTASPTIAPTLAPSVGQFDTGLLGRGQFAGTQESGGAGDLSDQVVAAPAADQSTTPAQPAAPVPAPADPGPAPADTPGEAPAALQDATDVALRQASDACFAQWRSESAGALGGAGAPLLQATTEGTQSHAAAGVGFALALGGAWGIAAEETEERRRQVRAR
jgi:hypothetical protein